MIELHITEPSPVSLRYVEAAIKPEQVKNVTPLYEPQTVLPDAGMTLSRVNVGAIPEPTEVKDISENGDHDVRRYGTARVHVQPRLQSRSVTPTKQEQTVTPASGFDGLDRVKVNPIPSEYIVPSGSLDITENGNGIDVKDKASVNVNVPVPPGYIKPQGKIPITHNGTVDVSQYAEADVDVAPSGIVFTAYNNDGLPTAVSISGISTVPKEFASNNRPIFANIDTLVINGATHVDSKAFEYWKGLKYVTINSEDQDVDLREYLFRYDPLLEDVVINGNPSFYYTFMTNGMKRLIINGNVRGWTGTFYGAERPAVELYDFSKCTSVFILSSLSDLPHAVDCVIRVPQALLADWQSATNWCDLTDVIWEGV